MHIPRPFPRDQGAVGSQGAAFVTGALSRGPRGHDSRTSNGKSEGGVGLGREDPEGDVETGMWDQISCHSPCTARVAAGDPCP